MRTENASIAGAMERLEPCSRRGKRKKKQTIELTRKIIVVTLRIAIPIRCTLRQIAAASLR